VTTGRRGGPVRAEALRRALVRVLFGLALLGAVSWAELIVLVSWSNGTLGYDYRAYVLAVHQLLAGQTMYDATAQSTGVFGLFFYPPPFAILVAPFTLLPADIGLWSWTLALVGAAAAAIWVMPVSARVKWTIGLLAALSWPLVYAIKLGQVGPILLLLFAIGWRWLDRPWPFGLAAGLGTVIKIQPALLLGWALVTGRRRAAVIGVGVVVVLAAIGTLAAGPGSWLDEASLLARVSRPILTSDAYGPGRLVYQAGFSETAALAVYYLNLALVVVVVLLAVLRASPVASYLAVVIATQFVSPVLWDHYALILLLPVAWLVQRGHWWAVLVPLATSTLLLGISIPVIYTLVFWVTLLAVTGEGIRDARESRRHLTPISTGEALRTAIVR
jgi:Glycosyltransferase family 87